ncbi:MAG TPA: hypothetical protein PK677_05025 [Acidiphilium sp.]|nr:hypothetical protein [Acidiphilium sp.]
MTKLPQARIWAVVCQATALILALGLVSCARTATPPNLAGNRPADPSAAFIGPSKILAVRPVSRVGAGGVSGVLSTIGAANVPREAGQEVIVRDAHGRVLSVLRPVGSAGPLNQTHRTADEIPDS